MIDKKQFVALRNLNLKLLKLKQKREIFPDPRSCPMAGHNCQRFLMQTPNDVWNALKSL